MTDQLKALREQAARIATEARAKFDEITDKTPEDRAAEIEREFDAMMADHDKITARAERLAKIEAAQRRAEAQAEADERAERAARRPGYEAAEDRGAGGAITYGEAFHALMRARGVTGDMDPEARAVLQRGYPNPDRRAQTTSDSAGGYTIPEDFLPMLVKSMAAWGPMYDGNVVMEMVTNGGAAMPFPTVNDTANTGVAHTEGATLTDDGGADATFGVKTLNAYAFNTEWIRISKELVDDSYFAMGQVMIELLGERLARLANTQLTTGSGSSAPHGIVTASTAGKTAAATAAITGDEIIDLVHSVDPAYRSGPKVAFMMNDATVSAVRKLKDGNGNYLWQMGDVQRGLPPTLLGYRLHINQAMDSLAAAKKVMLFGDFGKYIVRKVGQPLIGTISDKDFFPGFGVAGYIRFDGELADTAAVKHLITAAS